MDFKDSLQPPLGPLVPRFSRALYCFLRFVSPFYLRFSMKVRKVRPVHINRIVSLYRNFHDKQIRLIIAFRHPTIHDPQMMFTFISRWVKNAARREGNKLKRFPHACFIYDRGVPIWLGDMGNWLLPGVGAISLYRGKVDPAGLRAIRAELLNGEQPISLAPEGANTYHTDIVGRLNPGVAHFGFWCAEDLARAERTEDVLVLPISLYYHYRDPHQKWFLTLLQKLEADCFPGETPRSDKSISPKEALPRINRIMNALLGAIEDYYIRFYHHRHLAHNKTLTRQERIDAITDAALKTAEEYFGIKAVGDFVERQHTAEQAAWDWIYRNDIPDAARLSPYQKALADRIAAEAGLRMKHIQLADVMMYIRDGYLEETSTNDRFIEALSLCDGIVARLKGGNVSDHAPKPLADVDIVIGHPLSVTQRMPGYKADRRKAINEFMAELNIAFLQLVHEHIRE